MTVVGMCTDEEFNFMQAGLASTSRQSSNPTTATSRPRQTANDPRRMSARAHASIAKSATSTGKRLVTAMTPPKKKSRSKVPESQPIHVEHTEHPQKRARSAIIPVSYLTKQYNPEGA